MEYYKRGDAAKSQQIKTAFEKLGYKTIEYCFNSERTLYFTFGGAIQTATYEPYKSIIKTHHDYQELELPKPHYDIDNFHAGMPVLVRILDEHKWCYLLFSHCYKHQGILHFHAGGAGWLQCIPFNKDTEHLLGTTDMCDEQYINW